MTQPKLHTSLEVEYLRKWIAYMGSIIVINLLELHAAIDSVEFQCVAIPTSGAVHFTGIFPP